MKRTTKGMAALFALSLFMQGCTREALPFWGFLGGVAVGLATAVEPRHNHHKKKHHHDHDCTCEERPHECYRMGR